MHFLFFLASFKNFGFSTKKKSFLATVSYSAQEGIRSWAPTYFRASKKELVLGAVGAQEEIPLEGVVKVFERGF